MNILSEYRCGLLEIDLLAKKLANLSKKGDIFLFNGELGTGKTTFIRFFINSLFDRYKINRPNNIKSPSYPILINYPLLNNEIYHYDLYRLKNKEELLELEFFENLNENITLIEWPKLILDNYVLNHYYFIEIEFIDLDYRKIMINCIVKKINV